LNKITLKSIPTIRLIENHYLADVLFYFSKDRGQAIIDNITHLFNTSYERYSLGGIITWDILSHQREEEAETFTAEERANYDKLDIKYPRLKFKPHYFFSLGSPISAVLTFRGQDPKFYHPNFDTLQFENIFHPFDPLGYRFEPLFNDYFIDKPAVLVERSKGKTTHGEVAVGTNSNQDKDDKDSKSLYDGKSNAADDMTKNRNGSHTDEHSGTGNIWNDLEIEMNKPGPAITNPGESKADVAQDATLPKSNPDTKAKKEQKETDTDEDDIYTASFLPGGCRIDYVLQPESVMSMIANEYLIGLRAHFSYWTNKDFIWHMLRRIDEQLHEIAIEVEAEKKISKKEKQRRTKQKANTAASDTATASASSSSPAMTLVATDEAEDANGFSGNNDSSDVKRTTAVINSSPSIKSINNNSNKSIPKSASNNINSKKKGTDSPSLIINMDDTHLQKRIK
ncbi:DDHD domain-containing protein, partial [Mycotypha africana]|uniref:DDHD domain-containing protein n=1 Tax=Mycotypha africana TaxID=64632 RepID=UPI0023014EA8